MGAKISQSVAGKCHIKLGKKLLRLEPIGLVSIRIHFLAALGHASVVTL